MNALKIDLGNSTDQWLERDEQGGALDPFQLLHAIGNFGIFYRRADPNIDDIFESPRLKHIRHAIWSLSQYLKMVLWAG